VCLLIVLQSHVEVSASESTIAFSSCLKDCLYNKEKGCGFKCLKEILHLPSVSNFLKGNKVLDDFVESDKERRLMKLVKKYCDSNKKACNKRLNKNWTDDYETSSTNLCRLPVIGAFCKKTKVVPPTNNTVLSESFSDNQNENLWAKYRSELIRFFRQGTPSGSRNDFSTLQLATSGITAEWDTNDEILQNLCLSGSTWSQFYEPAANRRNFNERYYDFIMSLDVPVQDGITSNPQLKQQLDSIYAEQDRIQDELFEEEMNCEDKWYALPQSYRGVYEDYQRRRCRRLNDLVEESKILAGKAEFFFRRTSGGQKNYEARRSVINYMTKTQDRKFIELTKLKDFSARVKSNQYDNFKVEISSSSSSETASAYQSSFGVSFVVVSVNGAKAKKSLTTSMSDIKIKFGAKSWATINVLPDNKWFDGDVINSWKNGPFKYGKTRNSFFGPKGDINLIPRAFYVVYQPFVEMWVNKSDKEMFEKSSSFGISLNIGGFTFGYGQGSSLKTQQESDNVFKVTINSASTEYQIVAVDHTING